MHCVFVFSGLAPVLFYDIVSVWPMNSYREHEGIVKEIETFLELRSHKSSTQGEVSDNDGGDEESSKSKSKDKKNK